jgi:hypothetical protein
MVHIETSENLDSLIWDVIDRKFWINTCILNAKYCFITYPKNGRAFFVKIVKGPGPVHFERE